MRKTWDKIKEHLLKMNNKAFINNLFIILLISIIFLIVANVFLKPKKPDEDFAKEAKEIDYDSSLEEDYSQYLERKLASILGKIEGVGKVDVMITLETGGEKIPATNTSNTREETRENDSEGGTREIDREDATIQVMTRGNDDYLLVTKEIKPIVQGVIVVAEGAEDPVLKEILYEAAKTALGVQGNRVQVYSRK